MKTQKKKPLWKSLVIILCILLGPLVLENLFIPGGGILTFHVSSCVPWGTKWVPILGVKVKVLDYEGKPLEGAEVSGSFYNGTALRRKKVRRKTAQDGYAFIEGKSRFCDVGITIRKEGFYESHARFDYGSIYSDIRPVVCNGEWEPYGIEETFVLMEKKKPVGLSRHDGLSLRIPGMETPYGFDLEYGAFVAPHGRGKVADLFLTFQYEASPQKKFFSCRMTFPNEKDGAIPCTLNTRSRFCGPYEWKDEGNVLSEITFRYAYEIQDGKVQKEENTFLKRGEALLFRTRTILGADGEIQSAHYSKLCGNGIVGSPPRSFELGADVFFNPVENDKNLEGVAYSREAQKN